MNEMIERVARAVYEKRNAGRRNVAEWDKLPAAVKAEERRDARAAIAAMREPTADMLAAFVPARDNDELKTWGARIKERTWRAMIDAAIKEPEPSNQT